MFKLFSRTKRDIKVIDNCLILQDHGKANNNITGKYERTEEEEKEIMNRCLEITSSANSLFVQPASSHDITKNHETLNLKTQWEKTCCYAKNCTKLRCMRIARESCRRRKHTKAMKEKQKSFRAKKWQEKYY